MNSKENVSSKILICEKCNGSGTEGKMELTDYHKNEHRHWNEVCYICKGTGRMQQVIRTTTETTPYDNSEVTMLLLKETKETEHE